MRVIRALIVFLAAILLMVSLPASAADKYPSRPIHWIVGFGAGGSNDSVARIIGEWLSSHLGQQFVIVNRPGSGGMIGAEVAINSPPDGYTILFVAPNNTIGASLYKNLRFDFLRDTVAVAGLIKLSNVMVVRPDLPVRTIAEFIEYAKTNPGKLTFATSGNGTTSHMSAELLKTLAKIDMVHVPYRGSGGVYPDLLTGKTDLTIDNLVAALEHIRAGRLRALGVTTAERANSLPEVPAIGEIVPGYEASPWNGIVAPKGTPPEAIESLNKAANAALADPKIKMRIIDALGATPMPMSPAEFRKHLENDVEKWRSVINFTGVTVQ